MRPATWWGRRVDPERWFSPEQLEEARRYHRPLAAAASLRLLFQAAGLVALWWSMRGRGELLTASAFAGVGVGVVVVLWVPFVAVEVWSAFRHEPRFGGDAIGRARFVVSAMVTVGALVVAAAALALGFRWIVGVSWWPVPVAVAWIVGSAVIGPRLVPAFHRHDRLPIELDRTLSSVAAASGVEDVRFGRLGPTSGERGINAMAFGLRRPPLVLCTDALLDAEPEIRDFVVAHELAHLRRRHHRAALVVSALGSTFELGTLWVASSAELTSGWIDLADARSLPLVVGVFGLAGLLSGAAEAWVSRAHERQADADALAVTGSPGETLMRVLVHNDRSDLAPSRLARWFAPHPSPAERLAMVSR